MPYTVIFDGKYPISYLIVMIMFVLLLTVHEIFADQEKYQKFDLEYEGQGQGVEDRNLRETGVSKSANWLK